MATTQDLFMAALCGPNPSHATLASELARTRAELKDERAKHLNLAAQVTALQLRCAELELKNTTLKNRVENLEDCLKGYPD